MTGQISRSYSAFLDVIRLYAALSVFAGHAEFGWFGKVRLPFFMDTHDAVVMFFVLSGYVIAYSQQVNKRELASFIQARVSRLYATVIPAIGLSIVATIALDQLSPDLCVSIAKPYDFIRYLVTLGFMQSVWFRHLSPSINGAFWSLSYEFAYYMLFAVTTLTNNWKTRAFATLVVAAIAGPGIMLLLPAWLLGVFAFHAKRFRFTRFTTVIVAFVSAVIVAYATLSGWRFPLQPGTPPLNFSSSFISDNILAIGIAGALVVAEKVFWFDINGAFAKWIRRAGDLTFPIYLFHFPVLVLFAAAGGAVSVESGPSNTGGLVLAFVFTIALSIFSDYFQPSISRLIKSCFAVIRNSLLKQRMRRVLATPKQKVNR
ncbi:Acyltransferase family protein [Stieleria neptunia]|uniref:Acyltransferase family protein n=1 Tax=Stieleria neptunia TaxID=2527979 RepID=A0A518HKD3_9BACT|nr:acyltransferase [Stieleria neptunia]QDV41305.1 Acyltransferase family protein [Stieleria neptunia]